jgi:Sushi repeat (SCR repeat)
VVGYDFNVHSSIEYHCEAGHLLKGEAVRVCNGDGEWSSTAPNCQCKSVVLALSVPIKHFLRQL